MSAAIRRRRLLFLLDLGGGGGREEEGVVVANGRLEHSVAVEVGGAKLLRSRDHLLVVFDQAQPKLPHSVVAERVDVA